MASMSIHCVHKHYGKGEKIHRALRGISMEVQHGEFIALLGPSGSGKTSLLRAIAGLETIDAGTISVAADVLSTAGRTTPPEQRGISVVFQNHALWPHMSVFDNVAFPLREKQRSLRSEEICSQVEHALAEVGLSNMKSRVPGELSGGQKQRVALARAMVGSPRLILFDEPLASLDLELRWDMMRHIAHLRDRGITIIYVTHNQEEALALAHRIAVLDQGTLLQIAEPEKLVFEPATAMVAQFVGGGNVLAAHVLEQINSCLLRVEVAGHSVIARCKHPPSSSQVSLSIAQTAVSIGTGTGFLPTQLNHLFYQGHESLAEVTLTTGCNLQVRLPSKHGARVGDALPLQIHDAWVLPELIA